MTEVPALPLFVVTGASGAGKTTVTAPLCRLLPQCAVFEGDLINQVAALGWDMWRDTWLRIAHGVALNGRPTVLCTSLLPDQLESLPARKLLGPIRFCNLDCPDDVLAARLRARPSWRHSNTEEAVLDPSALRRLAPRAHRPHLGHQHAHPRRDSGAHRGLDPPPAPVTGPAFRQIVDRWEAPSPPNDPLRRGWGPGRVGAAPVALARTARPRIDGCPTSPPPSERGSG